MTAVCFRMGNITFFLSTPFLSSDSRSPALKAWSLTPLDNTIQTQCSLDYAGSGWYNVVTLVLDVYCVQP